MLEVPATLEWDFRELVGEQFVVSVNIGPLGDILVLTRPDEPINFLQAATEPIAHTLHHLTPAGIRTITLAPTQANLQDIQPLPDGRYVAVQSRARKDEKNAWLYDAGGQFLDSWAVGDAVWTIQASSDGKIWVSYFDEGVFSNDLGQSGLNTFDSAGNLIFNFKQIVKTSSLNPLLIAMRSTSIQMRRPGFVTIRNFLSSVCGTAR